jgi:hypothetical protein
LKRVVFMRNRFGGLNLPISSTATIVQIPVVETTKNDPDHIIGAIVKSLLVVMAVFSFVFLVIPSAFATSAQLKISSNQIVTASGGCTVRLKGVDMSGLEYSLTGDGDGAPTTVMPNGTTMTNYVALATEAVSVWHANDIRLPINQDNWCGCNTNGESAAQKADYQLMVEAVATYCENNNVYLDLDLHWSGTYGGTSATSPCSGSGNGWGSATGQQCMPDWNAVTFWGLVASDSVLKNNPAVLFDLFNEPYDPSNNDTAFWATWRNGGSTGSTPSNTPGLQTLLTTIRGVGANNVCVAGGLNWAFDERGIVGQAPGISTVYALTDTGSGNGVIYSAHCYSSKGYAVGTGWDPYVTIATSSVPVLVEEFGATSGDGISWTNSALAWINGSNDKSYVFSASAWAFSADVSPTLLTSFSGYPTTSYFGAPVSTWLYQLNETPTPNCGGGTPTPTNTATNTPTNTLTNTPTHTPTNTPTNTVTNTPTLTPTHTATNTPTNTPTSTVTNTITNTPTSTPTHTSTYTPTNTPSNTITNTLTNSPTNTATKTATNTATNTPTNTVTTTPTNSPTATITNTATNTATGTVPTDTPTNTATNSPTNSSTSTMTNTPTHTATSTVTNTPTNTSTHTVTNTLTNTPTNTATATITNTPTNTPTGTKTATPTNSATNTPTNTATNTPTNTLTHTPTNTPTLTSTNTKTNTPAPTSTNTPTNTATNTLTPQPTSTLTNTPTITATYTSTISSVVVIEPPFPNPSNGSPITFTVQVPGESTVTLDVFTLAFRKIYSQTIQADGLVTMQWDSKDITGIQVSNGLYYVRIHVAGLQSETKILKILILR